MKPFNASNALVACIDILGYTDILKNRQPIEYYEAIDKALSGWNNFYTDEIKNQYILAKKFSENIFLSVFSDTFIIAFNEQELIADPDLHLKSQHFFGLFSHIVSYLIKDIFLKTKHLMRGGIGRGKFFLKEFDSLKGNNFVFSEALAEAYHFAEKIADTPRVIICKNVFNQFHSKDVLSNSPMSALLEDNDGLFYLNIYAPLTIPHQIEIASFIEAKRIIEEAIKINNNDQIKLRKWIWFSTYHNEIINRIIKFSNNSQMYPKYVQFKTQPNLFLI